MDRNDRNTTDQAAHKRAVRRGGDVQRSAGEKSGQVRRPTGSRSAVTPMKRDSENVRKPSEQAGRAQGSLRRGPVGTASDPAAGSAQRRTGATSDPASGSARRRTGATSDPAARSAQRRTGAASDPAARSAQRRTGATSDPAARSAQRRTGATSDPAAGSAQRRTGATSDPAARSAQRRTGASSDPAARSAQRRTGASSDPAARNAQDSHSNKQAVRSVDGIVRKQGGRPDGKSKAMSKKKKKQKRAAFNFASGGVLIVAACVFIFSLYQLITMLIPYYSGGEEYDKIKDIAITADEEGKGFTVDFDALLKENEDTVAWIRFDEPAVINYPVVKSADNNEYLTKTFTANDNKLGAIFVDMRNNSDFSDRNTFIYGHHLNVGGEMFSELLEYDSESFCKKHPNFYIYTPDGKVRTYKVFSAGVVKDTADNYKIEYAADADYEAYLKLCEESSNYKVEDVELTAQSQIVSLSTCTNVRDDERFLVQGVLTAID